MPHTRQISWKLVTTLSDKNDVLYGVLYRYDDIKDMIRYHDKKKAKETYGIIKLAYDQGAQPERGALIRIEIIDAFGYEQD